MKIPSATKELRNGAVGRVYNQGGIRWQPEEVDQQLSCELPREQDSEM